MKFLQSILFFFSLLFSYNLSAQITESGDLVTKIGDLIDNMPSSTGDDYAAPSNTQLTTWENLLLELVQKKYAESELLANQLNYDLIQFTDNANGQIFFILQTKSSSDNYWGTYVFNPTACQSNLVIQAPHPRNDSNSGDQGIYILKEIGAMFYMVAGTHRCNSDNYSNCDGTTGTCDNGTESYRESDMAHIDNSIFHKTTEVLFANLPDAFFIQLHGFTKRTSDPYVILSNSTTLLPNKDYLSILGNNLVAVDPTLTYGVAHLYDTLRLKGEANTQGRLINGSIDPCETPSPMNSGHFLHIEQERSKLRADATGWQKMADALALTFRNLDLGTGVLLLSDFSALDTITSANTISDGDSLNLQGTQLVHLKAGFHAEAGSSFLATTSGCLSTPPLWEPPGEKVNLKNSIATQFKISPNPFTQSTKIDYQLTQSENVYLAVYHANGQLMKVLLNGQKQNEGFHQRDIFAADWKAGMYFVLLQTDSQVVSKKVVLISRN